MDEKMKNNIALTCWLFHDSLGGMDQDFDWKKSTRIPPDVIDWLLEKKCQPFQVKMICRGSIPAGWIDIEPRTRISWHELSGEMMIEHWFAGKSDGVDMIQVPKLEVKLNPVENPLDLIIIEDTLRKNFQHTRWPK